MSVHTDVTNSRSEPTSRSLSLVLPAYNEAPVIEQAIEEADFALRELCDDYEIIVVDDGSHDETASLVQASIAHNPSVRLIQQATNQGYGAALRVGFACATKDLVAFTDADCQFDLRELSRFLLLSQNYDIVCGYRIDRKDTALRRLYSRGYNVLVRMLVGVCVRDIDCALKLFRREVVSQLEIRTDGFLVNSELLSQATRQGRSIVEVGVTHRPRAGGESTVSIHHIPRVLTSLLRYWWNSVQFPGDPLRQAVEARQPGRGWTWATLALLLLAAWFTLANLNYPLIDRDETRYAEIPREMLVTGNWVLPQLNFEPYYDKPPLLYWLCALAYRLFGVHEWTARLIPALAACATLAATVWFGTRWFGRHVGIWSGVVLALTVGFLFCSRYLLIDGLFTALVTFTWMTAFEAMRGRKLHLGWWLLSATCCGLAILSKGPLAWVLCLPPLFAYAWLTERSVKPRLSHYAVWMLISLAVAIPWCISVALQDPGFLQEFLWTHNLKRFAGAFHTKPLWYFIPVVLIAGHPWSSLTLPLTRFLLSRSPAVSAERTPALGFLMLWCAWCFVFFSLSKCKLATYVLPIAPAAALIVGVYLARVLREQRDWSDQLAVVWSPRIAASLTCLAAVVVLAYQWVTDSDSRWLVISWGIAWLMLGLVFAAVQNRLRTPMAAWSGATLTTALFAIMMMHEALPAYSRSQTLLGSAGTVVDLVGDAEQVLTFGHEFSEVPFYLNRSDIEHWQAIDLGKLSQTVAGHRRAILFVPQRYDLELIRAKLPVMTKMNVVTQRSSGQLVQLQFSADEPQEAIATNSKAVKPASWKDAATGSGWLRRAR